MNNPALDDVLRGARKQSGQPLVHRSYVLFLLACVLAVCVLTGCSEESGPEETGGQMVIDESGSIDAGDTHDPDHGELLYDTYTFEANKYDRVRFEVATESFVPLLLLVEASTGAQLWEWQEEYSDEDALVYTIAGPGAYEARVYALEGGTGSYQIRVSLNE